MEGVINYLIKEKIYTKNEILLFHSTKEVKKSPAFCELAYKGRFPKNVKLVFTTSLIDEGLSIKQDGFTDVVFVETSYTPRPEAAKQFFARFRNNDKERKNYLYLRTKHDQTATKYQPSKVFEADKAVLESESQTVTSYSTYYDIFSNDRLFYSENHRLNPFYLAYQVTEVFSKTVNITQFLNYLRHNYNLTVNIDKEFENPQTKYFDDTKFKKQLKSDLATVWLHNRDEVLNIIKVHSERKELRRNILFKNIQHEAALFSFVLENLKDFERLFKKTIMFQNLGPQYPR